MSIPTGSRHHPPVAELPVTMAVRALRAAGVSYVPHPYDWKEKGAEAGAAALGLELGRVFKTLIFEDESRRPLVVVMDGAHDVSTKNLARALGVKKIAPVEVPKAERLSGYRVGGISPLGLRTPMPAVVHCAALDWPTIFVNGGHRGFLVELAPEALVGLLDAKVLDVAAPRGAAQSGGR